MNKIFGKETVDVRTDNEAPSGGDFPPARRSLATIKEITKGMRGPMHFTREVGTFGLPSWRVVAKFRSEADYELEAVGNSLNEVAYGLAEAISEILEDEG